jgi:hypothetical protein
MSAFMPKANPTRPVRIIDGFPPGGASDLVARLIGGKADIRRTLFDVCFLPKADILLEPVPMLPEFPKGRVRIMILD